MVFHEMNGWLAQEQDDRRALRWLLVSIAIHLPFTPLGPLFGLLALLSSPPQPAPPIEELHGIPVELLQSTQPAPEPKVDVEPTVSIPAITEYSDFHAEEDQADRTESLWNWTRDPRKTPARMKSRWPHSMRLCPILP